MRQGLGQGKVAIVFRSSFDFTENADARHDWE